MCIKFLAKSITRKPTNLENDIFCKATTTDTTINQFSNHPIAHKMAAFRYHIPRTHSLQLTPEEIQKEQELIQIMTRKNKFPQKLVQKLNRQIQHKINHFHTEGTEKEKSWTTFTYNSPKIRKITNLFKHTNIGIAFKYTNTLQQLTIPSLLISYEQMYTKLFR